MDPTREPQSAYTTSSVSGATTCAGCQPGFHCDNAICEADACTACPSGKETLGVNVPLKCDECVAGRYWKDQGSGITPSHKCENCEAGQFSTESEETTCKLCPMGWKQSTSGKAFCDKCQAGFFQNEEAKPFCGDCLPGFYSKASQAIICQGCLAGKFKSASAAKTEDCETPKDGYFVEHDNSSFQLPCPAGKHGRPNANNRDACTNCPEGWNQPKLEQTDCNQCLQGLYQAESGENFCEPCPAGFLQDSSGRSSCKNCNPGTISGTQEKVCTDCVAGYYSNEDQDKCAACPAGFYLDQNRQSSHLACKRCPVGTYSSAKGVEALSGCNDCSPGKFGTKNAAVNITDGCDPCGLGKYSASTGRTTDCEVCAAGRYNTGKGNSGCVRIPPGSYEDAAGTMTECEPGYKCEGENFGRIKCQKGSYASANGSVACIECQPGRVASKEAAAECDPCLPDTFSADSNQAECERCGADATTTKIGATDCDKCNAGKYMDSASNPKTCRKCPFGWFSDIRGAIACTQCKLGESYADPTKSCSACDYGKYGNSSWKCSLCASGQFQDGKGMSKCKQCPVELPVSNELRTSCEKPKWKTASDCEPNIQYLDDTNEDRMQWNCVSCPDGADCTGKPRRWHQVEPKPGYHRMSYDHKSFGTIFFLVLTLSKNKHQFFFFLFIDVLIPHSFILPVPFLRAPRTLRTRYFPSTGLCLSYEACSTNNKNRSNSNETESCRDGHNGELCSQCLPKWSSLSRTEPCTRCEDPAMTRFVFSIAVLIAILVTSFLIWDNLDGARDMIPKDKDDTEHSTAMPFHSIAIRIVSSYMQVAGMLMRFDLTLPASVASLVAVESGASSLGERLVMFECLTDSRNDFYLFMVRQIAMVWLIPLASILCCTLFWFVLFRRKWSFDGWVSSLMVLFYTLFPSIVTRVALTSSCRQYGSRALLTEALSVTCWSEDHWAAIIWIGLPGLLVFVLIAPFVLALKLIRQRKKQTLYCHQEQYDPKWTLQYGFIFAGYREGFEWWESVIMLRKCCFILLSIFLGVYGTTSQCVGASMILMTALSLQLQYRPFGDDDHNRLESIGLHACLLQLLVALLSNSVGKVGHSTLGPVSTIVLIFVMFGSTAGFFGYTLRVTIQSSKDAEGAVGILAKLCSKMCGKKRKSALIRHPR